MPDEIYFQASAVQRQDGFSGASANSLKVSSMTPEQALEYAELMKETFIKHWCTLTGNEKVPQPERALSANDFLVGITAKPLPDLGAFQTNLQFLRNNFAEVLDGLDAFASEPIIDQSRHELIDKARVKVLNANDAVTDAFAGL